jgi:hypothetical protein
MQILYFSLVPKTGAGQRSDNELASKSAITTVKESAPFEVFPDGYLGNTIDMEFVFDGGSR